VAFGNKVVVRAVAPLLVRADHRLTDAYGLARFTATLRDHLSNPGSLEQSAGGQDQAPIAQTPEADCPAAA
jgi:hypothetical protein